MPTLSLNQSSFSSGSNLVDCGNHWRIQGGSGGAMAPSPRGPFVNKLVFLCINHNVVSNTLVLSPRAICIHTIASFPTSNGFWRLKRFKQSMEEWTMNCKNSAQNALKVAIFRLKIENFSWEGAMRRGDTPSTNPTPLVASILAPAALGLSAPRSSRLRRSTLAPPFANPGSATVSWLGRVHCRPPTHTLCTASQCCKVICSKWRLYPYKPSQVYMFWHAFRTLVLIS